MAASAGGRIDLPVAPTVPLAPLVPRPFPVGIVGVVLVVVALVVVDRGVGGLPTAAGSSPAASDPSGDGSALPSGMEVVGMLLGGLDERTGRLAAPPGRGSGGGVHERGDLCVGGC